MKSLIHVYCMLISYSVFAMNDPLLERQNPYEQLLDDINHSLSLTLEKKNNQASFSNFKKFELAVRCLQKKDPQKYVDLINQKTAINRKLFKDNVAFITYMKDKQGQSHDDLLKMLKTEIKADIKKLKLPSKDKKFQTHV